MNILYIGTYRQKDTWGSISLNYIRSLISTNNNIAIRPIYLSLNNLCQSVDEDIEKIELSSFDDYDCVIQHCLPNYFVSNKKVGKNIGIYSLDIVSINDCDIIQKINLLDEILVSSSLEKETLEKAGITRPISIVGFPINISLLDDISDDQNPYSSERSFDNVFKIYTLLDSGATKNIRDTIISYILAFDYYDKTSLVIYANGDGQLVSDICRETIEEMNVSKKIREPRIISQKLTQNQILSLHRHSDCYINLNYGESLNQFSIEALLMGNNPIINKNTSLKDIVNDSNGFCVKSYNNPIMIKHNPIANNKDYYNANQSWYVVDIYDAIKKLRDARDMFFYKRDEWDKKSKECISLRNKFSYHEVGHHICTKIS